MLAQTFSKTYYTFALILKWEKNFEPLTIFHYLCHYCEPHNFVVLAYKAYKKLNINKSNVVQIFSLFKAAFYSSDLSFFLNLLSNEDLQIAGSSIAHRDKDC